MFNSLLYILAKAGKHYKMDFFMMQGNKQKIQAGISVRNILPDLKLRVTMVNL